MKYLFCATCPSFGPMAGDVTPPAHEGHVGTAVEVAADDTETDVARLFVGWLRINETYRS